MFILTLKNHVTYIRTHIYQIHVNRGFKESFFVYCCVFSQFKLKAIEKIINFSFFCFCTHLARLAVFVAFFCHELTKSLMHFKWDLAKLTSMYNEHESKEFYFKMTRIFAIPRSRSENSTSCEYVHTIILPWIINHD